MNETSGEHQAGSSEHRRGPRRVVRVVVGAFVVAAVALGVQAVAVGQQASITVSPSTAAQGDTVTISGNHPIAGDCAPGAARLTSTADLFSPDGFGPQVPSDASGNFTMTYTIPTSTPPGTYRIGMRCGGGNLGGNGSLTVTQAGTTTTTEPASTTTSTAPTTSTESRGTTTTAAPATTTTAPAEAATSGDSSSPVGWIVLAVVLVVGAGTAIYVVRRRRAST